MSGGTNGKRPKRLTKARRIGRREIVDPAIERRVPHLDRDVEHLVEREEHRDLDHDRQAAGHRVGADALVERHHLLVEPLLVVAEALAQLRHLRLEQLHLAHGAIGFVGEREEERLDEHRQQHDGEAEIADAACRRSRASGRSAWSGNRTSRNRWRGRSAARRVAIRSGRAAPLPWRRRRAGSHRWRCRRAARHPPMPV